MGSWYRRKRLRPFDSEFEWHFRTILMRSAHRHSISHRRYDLAYLSSERVVQEVGRTSPTNVKGGYQDLDSLPTSAWQHLLSANPNLMGSLLSGSDWVVVDVVLAVDTPFCCHPSAVNAPHHRHLLLVLPYLYVPLCVEYSPTSLR